MAKSFSISFNILGNLDPSLLAAMQNAAKAMKNLSNAAKSVNAISAAQKNLSNLKGQLAALQKFRELQEKNVETHRQRAAEKDNRANIERRQRAETERLAKMRAALEKLQAEYQSGKSEKGTRSDWARDMREKIRAAKAEVRTQESSLKSIGREVDQAEAKIRKLGETLHAQHAQLAQLGRGLNVGNIAAQESALRAQIESTTRALNQEISALERRNQIHSNFNQAQQNLSNAYSNFQNSLQTAETIMNPFKEASQNAMTFEYAMSKVKSLTQMRNIRTGNMAAVEREMAALTKQAEELGAATEFTSTEVAQAMGFFGMAGWQTNRIQAAMPNVVDLASIAGDHNIARTADVFTDLLTASGLQAGRMKTLKSGKQVEEASYFTDALAYAWTQSNVNRESFFEALKYNAPTAHAAELTLGESFAMNMVAANAGIKGSMAGTAFRTGWTRFLAPPKQAAQALESIGMTASDAQREVMETGAALEAIGIKADDTLFTKISKAYEHYQKLGGNDKAGFLTKLVGRNALSAWQTVFDSGKLEDILRIANEIDSGEIEGWAKDTASLMRDNTKTSIDVLNSSIDALQRSVGQALIPALKQAAEAIAPLITSAAQWVQQNQGAVQWMALLAGAISAVVVGLAAFSLASTAFTFLSAGATMAWSAITGLAAAFRIAQIAAAVWGAITAGAAMVASWPIWAIVGAVAAVIAILIYATGQSEALGNALSQAWNDPQGAIHGFASLVTSTIDSVVNYVVNRWNTLRSALSHPLDAVINFLDHGDVIGGNVISGEQQATQMRMLKGFSMPDTQVDTSGVSESLNQIPPPAMETSTALQTTAPPASQVATAFEMTAPSVTQLATAFPMTAANLTTFDASTQSATQATTGLTNALPMPIDGLNNLGAVSTSAAGQVGSMGDAAGMAASALAAKAAEISSISISVPTISVAAPTAGAVPVAANASGGIYSKGAFLTTFAEKSAEAAIPLDRSSRAIALWQQAGQMLGVYDGDRELLGGTNFSFSPSTSPVNITINVTVNGNADEQTVRRGIEESLPRVESFANQFAAYQRERQRRSFA